jgi:hypothetical protein
MNAILKWLTSEQGRRVGAWLLTAIGALIQGGAIPLDAAIPGLGISVGRLLPMLGIGLATVSGSNTRK